MSDTSTFELPRSDVSAVPPQGGYVAKRCPVRAQLDHDTTLTGVEQVSISDAQQSRIDAGIDFEREVLDEIHSAHPDAVEITGESRAEAQARTLAALTSDANVILGAVLPDDVPMRRAGRPDVLVRHREGWVPVDIKHHGLTEPRHKAGLRFSLLEGSLGPDQAAEAEGVHFQKSRLRDDALQLAHYRRMLEHLGLAPAGPAVGGIVDRKGTLWWIDLDEPQWDVWWAPGDVSTLQWYDHEFAFRLDVIAHTLARNDDPSLARKVVPVWTSECRGCPWRQVCRAELEEQDHVSLLPRSSYPAYVWHRRLGCLTRQDVAGLDPFTAQVVAAAATLDLVALVEAASRLDPGTPIDDLIDTKKRAARSRLLDAGIVTAGDLGRLDADTLAYAPAKVGNLVELIDQARVAVSGRPWRARGADHVVVPRADVEVDIDMENSETGTYLWGAFVHGDDILPDGYVPHVTWQPLDASTEVAMFAPFWNWLMGIRARAHAAGRTFAAYCYTAAENTHLRRIARLGGPGVPALEEVDAFIASDEWVDLHHVFASQIITGGGTGLKQVAPLAGFHWRDSDPGGDQSMVWYREAVYGSGEAGREANRRRLLDYNEDDVKATAALREWMSEEGPSLQDVDSWVTPVGRR